MSVHYQEILGTAAGKVAQLKRDLAAAYNAIEEQEPQEHMRIRLQKTAMFNAWSVQDKIHEEMKAAFQNKRDQLEQSVFSVGKEDPRFFQAVNETADLRTGQEIRAAYDRAKRYGDVATMRALGLRAFELGNADVAEEHGKADEVFAVHAAEYSEFQKKLADKKRSFKESVIVGRIREPHLVEEKITDELLLETPSGLQKYLKKRKVWSSDPPAQKFGSMFAPSGQELHLGGHVEKAGSTRDQQDRLSGAVYVNDTVESVSKG